MYQVVYIIYKRLKPSVFVDHHKNRHTRTCMLRSM